MDAFATPTTFGCHSRMLPWTLPGEFTQAAASTIFVTQAVTNTIIGTTFSRPDARVFANIEQSVT